MPHIVAGSSQFRSSLWLTEPPLEVQPTSIYLIWHARAERDAGLVWMRKLIKNIVTTQCAMCTNCVELDLVA